MAENRYKGALLAPWWKRAFCLVMDVYSFLPAFLAVVVPAFFIVLVIGILAGIAGSPDEQWGGNYLGGVLFVLMYGAAVLGAVAFLIWNYWVLRGATGRTVASRMWYLRLVDAHSGLPIRGGRAFLRSCLHILDVLSVGIGFLAPLWTPKRQTFADMIMNTVVVVDDRPVPPHVSSWRRARPPQEGPRPFQAQIPSQNTTQWQPQLAAAPQFDPNVQQPVWQPPGDFQPPPPIDPYGNRR